jgi:hypothetical protein
MDVTASRSDRTTRLQESLSNAGGNSTGFNVGGCLSNNRNLQYGGGKHDPEHAIYFCGTRVESRKSMKAFWKEPDVAASFRETTSGIAQKPPNTEEVQSAGEWSRYITDKWKDRRPQTVENPERSDRIRRSERLHPPERDPEKKVMYGISNRQRNESLDTGELIVPGGNRKRRIPIPGMAPIGGDPQFSFSRAASQDRFLTSSISKAKIPNKIVRAPLASYRKPAKKAGGLLA